MKRNEIFMPDGTIFKFWDDETDYKKVYHVNCNHPKASDDNPGTEDLPFATINRSAKILKPGEKVIVHGGIYRECVRPVYGGESPDRMIAYEAKAGEEVTIKGSQVWKTDFRLSKDWNFRHLPQGAKIWMGELPEEWFVGYNPFMTQNFSSEYTTFTRDWTDAEITVFMLKRGMIFIDGRPLKQVFRPYDLANTDGAFWVEDPGLIIHFRLWGDEEPFGKTIEVTTKEQIFAPVNHFLGYIRVSGFHFEHCADGIPVPQRAMVSARRGHHWIIENNTIKWANSCGIDVGNETWHRPKITDPERTGGHIIRKNYISNCGICGIAAVGNNANTLVQNNIIEWIGEKNIERIWETGGLKFHTCDTVLIKGNVFRHIRNAPGLWLDYLNKNCRITGNVFADIENINGAIYLEVNHAPNLVDNNILWDIRGTRAERGYGVNVDTNEECVVAHNFFGKIHNCYAVSVNLNQRSRIVGGRVGLCRLNKVLNNVFFECPKRIMFSRIADNQSDCNLFDQRNNDISLCAETTDNLLDLSAWQRFYGLDKNSMQTVIEANFDPETLEFNCKYEGEIPKCLPVPELYGFGSESPGPYEPISMK